MSTATKPTSYGSTCFPGGRTVEVHSAHREWTDYAANMLTAAPELLEVLTKIVFAHEGLERGCGCGYQDDLRSLVRHARHLLAKATGAKS